MNEKMKSNLGKKQRFSRRCRKKTLEAEKPVRSPMLACRHFEGQDRCCPLKSMNSNRKWDPAIGAIGPRENHRSVDFPRQVIQVNTFLRRTRQKAHQARRVCIRTPRLPFYLYRSPGLGPLP